MNRLICWLGFGWVGGLLSTSYGAVYLISGQFVIAENLANGVPTDITINFSGQINADQPDGFYDSPNPLISFNMSSPLGSTTFDTSNTHLIYRISGGVITSASVTESFNGVGALGHLGGNFDDFLFSIASSPFGTDITTSTLSTFLSYSVDKGILLDPIEFREAPISSTINISRIPEPSRVLTLGLSLGIFVGLRRR